VPILSDAGKSKSVIAFLDSSLAVIGSPADVKAAIGRRGHPSGLPVALAEKVKRFSGYDAWMVAAGPFPIPAAKVPPAAAAAGAPMFESLQRLESFDAGLRFNPDLEVSVEVVAGTVKDACGIAAIMGWLYSAMQSPANASGKKDAEENGKFEVHGRRILLSLSVPREKVRAALEQMRTQAASQNKAAGLTVAKPNAPKPGTIRIESSPSDMGTVVLSTEKDH